MKKWSWSEVKGRFRFDVGDDRWLLANLYITQALTLLVAVIILLFQRNNPFPAFGRMNETGTWGWAAGFVVAVLCVDMAVSKWVPEDAADDGGINEMLFGRRPLWHIALISAIVAVCEELLFRGAVQHAFGPYWTSIVFAAIHVRYLRHWLMTGMVFAISYGLGLIFIRTGSLWTPIAAHFAIDFVMGCIIKFRRNDDGDQSTDEK